MNLELLLIALLGLIIGSFLNVYILRLNTGRSTTGRSGCMSCGVQLIWRDLVPIFSFAALKGRCRACGSSISHQYWLVELTTAVLFVLVWVQGFSLIQSILALLLVSVLIVIASYDIRHTIIPNAAVYTFIALALIANIPAAGTFKLTELPLHFLPILISGALVAMPLLLLWLVSRGKWMGLGDVKLVFGFGLILNVYDGLMAIMLGFILGAIVGVILMYGPKVIKRISLSPTARRFTMSSEIPFAPFLIAGFFLVFLLKVDLLLLISALI